MKNEMPFRLAGHEPVLVSLPAAQRQWMREATVAHRLGLATAPVGATGEAEPA